VNPGPPGEPGPAQWPATEACPIHGSCTPRLRLAARRVPAQRRPGAQAEHWHRDDPGCRHGIIHGSPPSAAVTSLTRSRRVGASESRDGQHTEAAQRPSTGSPRRLASDLPASRAFGTPSQSGPSPVPPAGLRVGRARRRCPGRPAPGRPVTVTVASTGPRRAVTARHTGRALAAHGGLPVIYRQAGL
jgi:hypothetical protein